VKSPTDHFLAPVFGARNRRQSSGARNHDTLWQQMILADTMKMDSDFENFIPKFIFSYCSMSWKMLSSLHFIFHLCLQANNLYYRLLRLTNHSSAFQSVSSTKLNMLYPAPVSGTRKIRHQKGMRDWAVFGNWRQLSRRTQRR